AIREYAAARDGAAQGRFAASLAGAKVLMGALTYAAVARWFVLAQPPATAGIGLVLGLTIGAALWTNYSIDFFQARLDVRRALGPVAAANAVSLAVGLLLLPRLHDLRAQAGLFPLVEVVSAFALWLALRR